MNICIKSLLCTFTLLFSIPAFPANSGPLKREPEMNFLERGGTARTSIGGYKYFDFIGRYSKDALHYEWGILRSEGPNILYEESTAARIFGPQKCNPPYNSRIVVFWKKLPENTITRDWLWKKYSDRILKLANKHCPTAKSRIAVFFGVEGLFLTPDNYGRQPGYITIYDPAYVENLTPDQADRIFPLFVATSFFPTSRALDGIGIFEPVKQNEDRAWGDRKATFRPEILGWAFYAGELRYWGYTVGADRKELQKQFQTYYQVHPITTFGMFLEWRAKNPSIKGIRLCIAGSGRYPGRVGNSMNEIHDCREIPHQESEQILRQLQDASSR